MTFIEVRINKEVRDYQESLFFGLSLRQFLFALLAVLVAMGVYFGLRNVVGTGEVGWMCVLAAFPFALGGFFTYNGMTFERFVLAFIRSEFLCPKRLAFRSENLYAKALDHSTIEKTAERIRKLRKQKKYTQEELAEELSIDRSVLSRIEIGKYTCSVEFLAQVSDFFGVPLDYLVFGRERARNTTQLKNSIAELIQQLEHFKEQI